ncbi:MAG: DUF4340 domain-containing protein [Spirochaetes bacterium]|nr:DUF4340 domain-containing protein [Spirochaetota bacterium]
MAETKIKDKKLIYLTVLFIVLLVYYLIFEKKIQKRESAKNNLFSYVIADINNFEIIKNDKVLSVSRILNKWKITSERTKEFEASKMDIDSYLSDVKQIQRLKVINENTTNLGSFGLTSPKLSFKAVISGKPRIFHLGNKNPDNSGYYAKFADRNEIFLVDPAAESTIDKELYYFRDKSIFTYAPSDIRLFSFKDHNIEYILEYKDGKWGMSSPVVYSEADEQQIKNILNSVIDITIKNFFDGKRSVSTADAGMLSSDLAIKLIDNKNETIILKIGKNVKDAEDQYYAGSSNRDMVISVDKAIIDDIHINLKKLVDDKHVKDEEIKKKTEEEMKKKDEDTKAQDEEKK